MKIKVDLEELKKFFQSQEMPTVLVPHTENNVLDQLYILLDKDELDRDVVLQLRVAKQEFVQSADPVVRAQSSGHHTLQFVVPLPFTAQAHMVGDLARFLLILNKAFELPGLELSEGDGLVYYRYVFISQDGTIDKSVILSIVAMVLFITDTFAETLESLATGQRSLREIIEEAFKVEA